MAHLLRLIVAVWLAAFAPGAIAAIAPTSTWDTSSCNDGAYPLPNWLTPQNAPGANPTWVCQAASASTRTCGYTHSGGIEFVPQCHQVQSLSCPANSSEDSGGLCQCASTHVEQGGQCRPKNPCQAGYHEEGGQCVKDKCDPDEVRVNGICVKEPPCPPGETRVNGVCKKNKCKAGASAGDYTDLADAPSYICEMSGDLACMVFIKPTICVSYDGQKSCSGEGRFTGASCTGGGDGSGGNGNPGTGDPGTGTGGTGTGGTGTGGTGTGGTGTGGTGTGGTGTGGTGTGGTGTGGTGTGGTGTGGTGTGGTGTGGTGTGGTGTGGTGTGGTGSGSGAGGNALPPPKPIPPAGDGTCGPGYHKSGEWCIKDSEPPNGDGKCPEGSVKVGATCVFTEPPRGGGAGGGTGSGSGNGDGDGEGDESGFGGACASGFACEGDAIQCAIAKEQHLRNCKLFDDESAESKLYNDNKGKEGNQTKDLPGNETVNVAGRINSSDALGAGYAGISDLNVTVWGQSISLPFSMLNPYLAALGNVLLAVSFLLALRIVARG